MGHCCTSPFCALGELSVLVLGLLSVDAAPEGTVVVLSNEILHSFVMHCFPGQYIW